jgi:hypothetical protein
MSQEPVANPRSFEGEQFCTVILSFSTSMPGKSQAGRGGSPASKAADDFLSRSTIEMTLGESKPLTKISLGLEYATFSACRIS